MITIQRKSRIMDDIHVSPSLKESLTKSHKLKRVRVRQDTLRGKTRNRKMSSPQIISDTPVLQAEGHLSFPTELSGYCTPPHSSSPHASFSFSGIFPGVKNGNDVFSVMERKRHSTPYIFSESLSDSNEPLDMTKKCCKTSEQSETVSYGQLQQQRPSVITCAPALMHSHCQRTDHMKNVGQPSLLSVTSLTRSRSSSLDDNIQPGYRREVVSGMCDPVIDEHFRRSLGKDYPEFLSSATSTAPSVSVTVDDHFAKALGDIWLRLQHTKPGRRDIITTTTTTPVASGPRMTSGSPSSSPLLQHPQRIVST
ncbi:uncharacterized protein LOC106460378 isoform X2 [Limulus polyphemus]|uniref:Uncharacterized protein LOC106460378 isoform X2 n=1 Tax=Limulus polyphemus TaxID=6850 RepID=A0ABM1SGN8_LIMPO|nr:uncharacterized protein LOC106460378 isoform X2 [Limulus polyphemus]